MTTDIIHIAQATGYDEKKIQLVKDTIAQGASDDELMLFLHLAQRTGLDPFTRQIYLIERQAQVNGQWKTTRQPLTGIDGLRLIAERTERYMPGREPTFEYDANGQLFKATAYVKKWTRGEWHEIAASAHYSEYVGTKRDGTPTRMWAEKPHIMLAKCAEALALRRSFPADLSGIYSADEFSAPEPVESIAPRPVTVSEPTRQLTAPPEAQSEIDRLQRDLKALRECERSIGLPLPIFSWKKSQGAQPLKDEITASRARIEKTIPGLIKQVEGILEDSTDVETKTTFSAYAWDAASIEVFSHADLIKMAVWLFQVTVEAFKDTVEEADLVEEPAL